MDAGLKKEMGLWHVIGDYNHRKQEHNSLEYTDSRKCVTREGQEDGERERDEEKDETKHCREREICYRRIKSLDGDKDKMVAFLYTILPSFHRAI